MAIDVPPLTSANRPIAFWLRIASPMAAVAMALAVGLVVKQFGKVPGALSPYVFFTFAIIFSAIRTGTWGGILATILSALATGFFHLHPFFDLKVSDQADAILLILFLFEGVVLSFVSPALSSGISMSHWPMLPRYCMAILMVGVVVGVKSILGGAVSQSQIPFMLFYSCVMIVSWTGGPGPGLLATFLSTTSVAFLFFEPKYQLNVEDPRSVLQLSFFLVEGTIISLLSGSLTAARRRADEQERLANLYWDNIRASEARLRKQNQVLVDLARQTEFFDFDDTLRELTVIAVQTVDVARASVWLLDTNREVLHCLDLYHSQKQIHERGRSLLANELPCYFAAIAENRSLAAHEAQYDPRTKEFAAGYLIPLNITSMLDAPIRLSGAVIGLFCLEHIGASRQWVVEEEQFAGSLADFVALALKRRDLRAAQNQIVEQASLLEQAHDAIATQDALGLVRYWNRGAEDLYGWSAAEVLGRSMNEFLPISHEMRQQFEEALQGDGEWTGELKQLTKQQTEVIVSARITLLKNPSGQNGHLMIATDITESRSLELKFLRAQRMESIGALACGFAHDLNNLLTPVVMGSDLLRAVSNPAQRDKLLNTIQASAERAAGLLKHILTFASGASMSQGPVELRPIVIQLVDLLGHTLPKSIVMSTSISPEVSPIAGPATQIDQILMNLCVNARDAMPEGGRIFIAANNRDMKADDAALPAGKSPGCFVELSIADTGTGIPQEIIDRIYDPFFTTKEPGKGTGLGLATTREIVEGKGGFIHLESKPGKGTRFSIYLPALQPTPQTSVPDTKETPIGKGELILVADDESSVRELAMRVLETYGYRVVAAAHGSEAVRSAREQGTKLSLILLDMMMPGQDVETTVAELKRAVPTVPLLLTSGIGMADDTSPNLGENAFLPKPYNIPQLLQLVHKVLEGK